MRKPSFMLAVAATLMLAACSGKDKDSDSDTDTDSGMGFESCASTDGVSPSITEAIIDCLPPHQDGADRVLQLTVTATDPQGDFTLSQFQNNDMIIYLAANGQELHKTAVACKSDDPGNCVGSVPAPSANVDCGKMENYRFAVVVSDEDGNLSPECTALED